MSEEEQYWVTEEEPLQDTQLVVHLQLIEARQFCCEHKLQLDDEQVTAGVLQSEPV